MATFKLDLAQLSSVGDGDGSTFNLLIYARNLKGESEKTLLENIAFNDAARRTGEKILLVYGKKFFSVVVEHYFEKLVH